VYQEDHGPPTPNARVRERIVEIVSDSGEGAQKAGQAFAAVSGKMGNGVWTVEIIPAEIKPPARSRAGASGIRVRFGSQVITNMGDEADLVVAFNEQVLYGRIAQRAYKPGTIILLENKWAKGLPDERRQYAEGLAEFKERGFDVRELAMEEACKRLSADPRVGKNMFVLGMLCRIFMRDMAQAESEIHFLFGRKKKEVVDRNIALVRGGYEYAAEALPDLCTEVPPRDIKEPLVVMNGNQAVGLGALAAGIEMTAMYPITPATSASHYIAGVAQQVGAAMHQAEDEIAAMGFALGASFAGKTALTITSGPGLALKTELLGLAVMAEIPLVMVNVQRGGPSTGLPTKVEQGDLLASLYGATGDAPKIIMAPATIEECFHVMITARRLAEAFRGPVLVLTDANLATGVQPFARPQLSTEWLSPPIDQSPWQEGLAPYAWDPKTGLSPRPVPGQKGGEYTLTGLAHTQQSKVAYDPESNQKGCDMRSRKLATLQATLKPPKVHGDEEGDLLVVGWGSTLGAIEEAVDRVREKGMKVSSCHLRFLSPMEPGLKEIFSRFKRVMTVEINYSDDVADHTAAPEHRRMAQLANVLRSHTLLDVDCWSNVAGQPLRPGPVVEQILRKLSVEPGTPAMAWKESTLVRAQV
jgi:2-oxoglutarate/2-oxoacid ferredoxin oxidoreductase subunit alpha